MLVESRPAVSLDKASQAFAGSWRVDCLGQAFWGEPLVNRLLAQARADLAASPFGRDLALGLGYYRFANNQGLFAGRSWVWEQDGRRLTLQPIAKAETDFSFSSPISERDRVYYFGLTGLRGERLWVDRRLKAARVLSRGDGAAQMREYELGIGPKEVVITGFYGANFCQNRVEVARLGGGGIAPSGLLRWLVNDHLGRRTRLASFWQKHLATVGVACDLWRLGRTRQEDVWLAYGRRPGEVTDLTNLSLLAIAAASEVPQRSEERLTLTAFDLLKRFLI